MIETAVKNIFDINFFNEDYYTAEVVVLFIVTEHDKLQWNSSNEISAEQHCAANKKPDVAIALDFVCVDGKRNLIEIRLKHHWV